MKGITKFVAGLALLALVAGGSSCSVLQNGAVVLPTQAELSAACKAEVAAGTPSGQAPDCVADYVIQQACNIASLGVIAVATVPSVNGSLLLGPFQVAVNTCEMQGFLPPGTTAKMTAKK